MKTTERVHPEDASSPSTRWASFRISMLFAYPTRFLKPSFIIPYFVLLPFRAEPTDGTAVSNQIHRSGSNQLAAS